MPFAAPHPCAGRCGELVPRGRARCDACQAKAGASDRAVRGSARERGYDANWEKRRALYLQKHPLCVECLKDPKMMPVPATVVDHIVPHKGDEQLFDDDANLQGLCERHHNAKTAREDMGAWRPS